jgi:ATP-dependent DNA helicase RecQ
MERLGLKRLSTFGILTEFTQGELVQALDALDRAGLIECSEVDRFRPIVNLTEKGWGLLRSKGPFDFTLSLQDYLYAKVRNGGLERVASRTAASPRAEPPPRTIAPAFEEAAEDEAGSEPSPLEGDPLWNRLKSLRSQWAREAKQPAYCIFSNQTLEALVRSRPQTPQALAGIKGLGPARLERYGTALLEAIGATPSAPETLVPPASRRMSSSPPPTPPIREERPSKAPASFSLYVPTEEWTWRLLDRGFTIEEAAAIRGLEPAIVIRHVTWMARQGRPVALEAFLEVETLERWEAWRAEHGEAAPPSDPPNVAAFWPLFLACRA